MQCEEQVLDKQKGPFQGADEWPRGVAGNLDQGSGGDERVSIPQTHRPGGGQAVGQMEGRAGMTPPGLGCPQGGWGSLRPWMPQAHQVYGVKYRDLFWSCLLREDNQTSPGTRSGQQDPWPQSSGAGALLGASAGMQRQPMWACAGCLTVKE